MAKKAFLFKPQPLREGGTEEAYFFDFSGSFFIHIYKYVQKLAQNDLCWSNIRDFISSLAKTPVKKGIYSVSILRIGFRSMHISL